MLKVNYLEVRTNPLLQKVDQTDSEVNNDENDNHNHETLGFGSRASSAVAEVLDLARKPMVHLVEEIRTHDLESGLMALDPFAAAEAQKSTASLFSSPVLEGHDVAETPIAFGLVRNDSATTLIERVRTSVKGDEELSKALAVDDAEASGVLHKHEASLGEESGLSDVAKHIDAYMAQQEAFKAKSELPNALDEHVNTATTEDSGVFNLVKLKASEVPVVSASKTEQIPRLELVLDDNEPVAEIHKTEAVKHADVIAPQVSKSDVKNDETKASSPAPRSIPKQMNFIEKFFSGIAQFFQKIFGGIIGKTANA